MFSTTQFSSGLASLACLPFLPKKDFMFSARVGGSDVASRTPLSASPLKGADAQLPLRFLGGMLSIEFCDELLVMLGTLPRRARYVALSVSRMLLASVV